MKGFSLSAYFLDRRAPNNMEMPLCNIPFWASHSFSSLNQKFWTTCKFLHQLVLILPTNKTTDFHDTFLRRNVEDLRRFGKKERLPPFHTLGRVGCRIVKADFKTLVALPVLENKQFNTLGSNLTRNVF